MSGLALKLVEPDPDDPLHGFGDHLVLIEQDIRGSDLASLKSRHQSGTWMLKLRVETKGGKRLPQKARQLLIVRLGISAPEINHRMKLAEKYQVKDLPTLVGNFTTWDNIRRHALYEKRPPAPTPAAKTAVPLATTVRGWSRKLDTYPRDLSSADRRELIKLANRITKILNQTTASEVPHS